MMWETLLEIARQLAAAPPAMTAMADAVQPSQSESTAPQTAPEPECPNPGQTHSAWTLDSEERWFDGQWVMRSRHYSRVVTDNCDGTETTETKTEGPERLWQAVPGERVSDVNRPAGSDDTVTGAPLGSSDAPAGQQAAPVGPQHQPATNTPGTPAPSDQGSSGAAPFLPGVLLLVGLIVAAWKQKRGSGGPDLDGELLAVKARQYQSRARRGQWSPEPMFSEDPEFAGYAELYSRVKPETKTAIDGWQNEWDAISAYWEKFFAGTDHMGPPPSDKWGIGDIARAHAAELLQGKLANFRAILHQLAEDPHRFDSLSPELQDLARSIEHIRSVLPSEEAEKIFRDAFAGDEAMVGELILDLKKQQYGEQARGGRFDQLDPQFAEDERYKPFTLITPLLSADLKNEIDRNQTAWKEAALYWQRRLSGDSTGDAPADVLGISAAAAAAWADLKRRDRWARVDRRDSDRSETGRSSSPAPTATKGPEEGTWAPNHAEALWLTGFFHIDESGYGPETQAAVRDFQSGHGISADSQGMIGPRTVEALIRQRYQDIAAGRRDWDDDDMSALLNDGQLSQEMRGRLSQLSMAYARYVVSSDNKYRAILRMDKDQVSAADTALADAERLGAEVGGVRTSALNVLAHKYQSAIDSLHKQAQIVADTASDGEYAKLLAMLGKAQAGETGAVESASASVGDRWAALWSRDASQRAKATAVVDFLAMYSGGLSSTDVEPHHAGLSATPASDFTPQRNGVSSHDGWGWPETPLQLGGASQAEVWLTNKINTLNSDLVPDAALLVVRNREIVALKNAGSPPTSRIALRSVTDPEVQAVISKLTWNQNKIDQVWAKAGEFGIDPRVMLAVVIQEGTGSFNTNAAVPAQFWQGNRYVAGGSGAQPEFKEDLDSAMEAHLLSKVKAYGYYAPDFKRAVTDAGLGDGNVFQYSNYNVPWVKESGWTITPGCYATHTEWWRGVTKMFDALAGDGATEAYSQHLADHPLQASAPAPTVFFVKTKNGTGQNEGIVHQPWIEARP